MKMTRNKIFLSPLILMVGRKVNPCLEKSRTDTCVSKNIGQKEFKFVRFNPYLAFKSLVPDFVFFFVFVRVIVIAS